jgi:hypothetical protein
MLISYGLYWNPSPGNWDANRSVGVKSRGRFVQATDGNLYGTNHQRTDPEYGVVFRLSLGLAPFVETLPAIRQVGTQVFIPRNNLTGSTAVSFDGTAAAFTVVSDTEITTTVPTGAITGFVTVTTPGGTLTSNKPFQVIP